jgi:hypothetical protein
MVVLYCQGTEISAAELKRGPKKFVQPEKLAADFSLNMPKKGRKGAELFLG